MSYNVNVANRSITVSTYAAAVAATRAMLNATAANIRNGRLLRSPKVRSRIAAAVEAVTIPKKAGTMQLNIGGLIPVRIVKG